MSVRWNDTVARPDGPEAAGHMDDALEQVFAPHRVDALAFERALAARVAAREAAEGETAANGKEANDTPPAHAAFWRRVAAVLPFDAGAGAAASGAAAAKVFGGKVLPATLLLPALVLAAASAAFFAGLRRIKTAPSADSSEDLVRGDRTLAAPKTPWWVHAAPLVLIGLVFSPWPAVAADALTLSLACSTLALAYGVRQFHAGGVNVRRGVALTVCDHSLGMLLLCFLQAAPLRLPIASSEVGLVVATAALLVALARAHVVAASRWVSLPMLVFWGAILYVLNPMGLTFSAPILLRPKLAAMDLAPEELSQWREAAAVHRALVAVGSPAPEPRGARARLAEVLASGRARDVHPVVWTAALDFGWFGEAEWRSLAAQLPYLRPASGPGPFLPVLSTGYQRFELAMSLAGPDVAPAWREVQVVHLERSWPSTGQHGALVAALEVVRRLELLDRADLVGPLRERAHALLRDHWVSRRSVDRLGRDGGFTPNPAEFRTSFVADTLAAVELMSRFGVPDGFDVDALRSYLRHESRADLSFGPEVMAYLHAEARAALLRLDRELELPPVSFFERVLDERFTIAALLLAALGLIALRNQAPIGPGAPLRGRYPS